MKLYSGADGFQWRQFLNHPFDVPVRSRCSPECYWRQRGNVKDSLGFKSRQAAREGRRGEKGRREWRLSTLQFANDGGGEMIQEGVGVEKEAGKRPGGERKMIMVNDRQLQGSDELR